MKAQFICPAGIGNIAEQDNRSFAAFPLVSILSGKIFNRQYIYFNLAGHSHSNYSFTKEITGRVIFNNKNTFCLNERNPCFQYLTVDKPVIYSNQNYVESICQLFTLLLFCLIFHWPG